ncbi:MAG: MBL fold metallo-hydrolase [Arenimonas sp.]|nr:MBL fold metallo-hydrolase [Arenimonas sp.]
MPSNLVIEAFYDLATYTFSYLVMDMTSREAAVIDSVWDYDPKSGRTSTQSADKLINRIRNLNADVRWHLETHVHADHLSAAQYLKKSVGGRVAISSRVTGVQNVFGKIFNAGSDFSEDGSQFDVLLADDETLAIGPYVISVLPSPGHTPACVSYRIDDGETLHLFIGDTLFMPDYGTARCDFPGGDAGTLYDSIQRIFSHPQNTKLYMCHDYPPATRSPEYLTTVGDQRRQNIHIHDGVSRDQFIAMRNGRDAQLSMPVLLLPSVQVNMRAGNLPAQEVNGVSYLKIPVNML